MTNLEKVTDMYQMINTGQTLEAFEKYYHPNVIMKEIGEEPRVGKEANRIHEKNFLGMIKEYHGGGVLGITSNETENKTMVESWGDLTFQNGMRVKLEQVAVQTWEGDLIVNEIFYHK